MVEVHPPHGQSAVTGFSFRSDRLALDFAATLMFRAPGATPVELLGSPARLARWAVESGLLKERPAPSSGELVEAIELREAIYRIASARLADARVDDADVSLLNERATRPPLVPTLGSDGTLVRSGTVAQVVATVACDAIELFGGPDAERLRRCGRSGCTRLFVDRTRGQSRMWCGMRQCGNRVNAAAYRRRRAAEHEWATDKGSNR